MTSQPLREALGRTRQHWAIALVTLATAALIFPSLGRDALWADEGDTAVLSASILTSGVPTAWDGVTFSDSDYGYRLTDDFVMVSHPWLQYYATAAAFALFGESAFAARLPFAISGLLTVLLVYVIVLRASGDRLTALSAAVLVALSVQFLIYSRQSRQYSLNAAIACVLILQFERLRSWRRSLLFAAGGIALFHTHPGGAALLAALGLLTLFYKPLAAMRRWYWSAAPIVALFTVPWLFLARSGYAHTFEPLQSFGDVGARLLQFGVEAASVTPLLGALALYLWSRRRRDSAPTQLDAGDGATARDVTFSERTLAVTLVTIIAALCAMMMVTQSAGTIWVVGLRETPAVIPFAAILTALALRRAARPGHPIWLALVLVLAVTRLGDLTPWTSWQGPTATLHAGRLATFHTPTRPADRLLHSEFIAHIRSLVTPNPGTVAHVSRYLREYARSDEIVITNYEWEALYFHTKLPQGMKILPGYPIYERARARQLPSYVFGADGVRWIVWRRTWGPYRGQACDQILSALREAGIPVELVAVFPETIWENRENLHFRRFANGGYLYDWFPNVPDTLIYRVDWPKAAGSGDTAK